MSRIVECVSQAIRFTFDAHTEVFVPGNHRLAARPECSAAAAAEALRLCQKDNRYARTGQAVVRRQRFCSQLDCRHRLYRIARLLWAKKGRTAGTRLVP